MRRPFLALLLAMGAIAGFGHGFKALHHHGPHGHHGHRVHSHAHPAPPPITESCP